MRSSVEDSSSRPPSSESENSLVANDDSSKIVSFVSFASSFDVLALFGCYSVVFGAVAGL